MASTSAVDLAPAAPRPPARPRARRTPRAVDAAVLLGLAVIAAGLRFYRLGDLPPGLHHDEAVNGLDALFTVPTQHPIFFEANNGREPLFIYLQWAAINLFGPSAWSLRATSAIVGVLTVLAVYWLGREWLGRVGGAVAAFALATSFWHLDLSRVGLRAIAAPLFLTLALAFLWRGMRDRRLVFCAAAGACVALDLYTYTSARVVLALVPAIFAWELLRPPRPWRRRLLELAVVAIVTAVLVAPLGQYFLVRSDSLIRRADEVWIFNPNPQIESKPVGFVENTANTLGMFFVRGDLNPRQNLPGRPVFDPVAAPWFVVGLIVLVWRALASLVRGGFQAAADETSATTWQPEWSGWLLLWLAAMLSLGALTYESPDFLRLSALAPATFLTWALGLVVAARWLVGRLEAKTALAGLALGALVVGLLGFEAGRTARDYFGVWAGRADVYEGFDSSLSAAARLVEGAPPDRSLVFYVDRSPVILFESPRSRGGRWLQQYSDLLLLPRDLSGGATYVFGEGTFTSGVPTRFFPDLTPVRDVDGAGNVGFVAYNLTPGQLQKLATPATPKSVAFGGADGPVEIVGYTLDRSDAKPGDAVSLTVLWRARSDLETVYAPYLHVVDDNGHAWGQDDPSGFAVNGWKAGDLFLSRFAWSVPVGAPPGSYHLEVGISKRVFGVPPGPPEPLGAPIELAKVSVSGLSVLPPGTALPQPSRRLDASLGDGLVLAGTSDLPVGLKEGDQPELELLWEARTAPTRDLQVDVALEGATGSTVVISSRRPGGDSLPTSAWPAGTVLRDLRRLPILGDAPTGRVQLVAIARDAHTGQQIGRATLGTLDVAAPSRDFAIPHPTHPLNVRLGDEIALLGYDVSPASLAPGGTLHVTLYWQDLATPDRNYTVFAHLLDPANHVVAQQDRQPEDGQAPTVGWIKGQVVKDAYDLPLQAPVDASALTLEVGMYDATTGARLPTSNGDAQKRVVLTTIPLGGASG